MLRSRKDGEKGEKRGRSNTETEAEICFSFFSSHYSDRIAVLEQQKIKICLKNSYITMCPIGIPSPSTEFRALFRSLIIKIVRKFDRFLNLKMAVLGSGMRS